MRYEQTYDSIAALAEAAEPTFRRGWREVREDFCGVASWKEAERLAVDGWAGEAQEAERIALESIDTVEQEHDAPSFHPVWDVTGCEVDVGRYLSGEPENMVDYEPVKVPRHGRVITLCASVSYSVAVSAQSIKRRGRTIAALAFALTKYGYNVELWADVSAYEGNNSVHTRTLVKGANDELDPARVMFAYAHPAMLRVMVLGARHALPESGVRALGPSARYGIPCNPTEDMPEGTIYLPCLRSSQDVPAPEVALRTHLRELGILAD